MRRQEWEEVSVGIIIIVIVVVIVIVIITIIVIIGIIFVIDIRINSIINIFSLLILTLIKLPMNGCEQNAQLDALVCYISKSR